MALQRFGARGPYDGSTRLGALRNAGYQAAQFNVRNLKASGLSTPVVWVDVEPLTPPFAWSKDIRANRAVVTGTLKGFTDAGYRVGLYSTPLLWRRIVGDLPSVMINGEVIDDVVIDAQGTSIDGPGGILGQAGPTHLRPESAGSAALLPARGIMSWVLTVAMVPAVATRTSSVPHVAIECSATSMPRMRCARICAVTSGGTVPPPSTRVNRYVRVVSARVIGWLLPGRPPRGR